MSEFRLNFYFAFYILRVINLVWKRAGQRSRERSGNCYDITIKRCSQSFTSIFIQLLPFTALHPQIFFFLSHLAS